MNRGDVASSRVARVLIALCLVLLAGQLEASPARAAWPNSLGLDATYNVDAQLSWGKRRLIVTTTATVVNSTSQAFSQLTFNLVPTHVATSRITEASVNGTPVPFTRDGQNLLVDLPTQLGVGGQASVRIGYRAWFNKALGGSKWLFAKTSGIASAYRWIPWLSQANTFIDTGDPFATAPSSDVRVTITADRALVFATTGRLVAKSGLSQTFRASNVPDFNFSASPHYRVTKVMAGAVELHIYTRNLAWDKLAYWAKKAVGRFTSRIGPYAYGVLSVAETPGGYAMESPAHIWIPATSRARVIPYRVVHEVAHQWFYAAVVSNQAREPFADEAVVEFMSRDLLGHRQPKCAAARLDLTLYDYGTCYYDIIYTQGDRYLDDYRVRHGNDRFWSGLRDYYERYKFRFGGTRRLLDALDAATGYSGGHASRFPSLY